MLNFSFVWPVVANNVCWRLRQFGTRAEVSTRHWCRLSGHFGTSLMGPKCLDTVSTHFISLISTSIDLHFTWGRKRQHTGSGQECQLTDIAWSLSWHLYWTKMKTRMLIWSLAEMPTDWIDNQSHCQMMVSLSGDRANLYLLYQCCEISKYLLHNWRWQHHYDCWSVMSGLCRCTAVKDGPPARLWRLAYRQQKCGFCAKRWRFRGEIRRQTKKCYSEPTLVLEQVQVLAMHHSGQTRFSSVLDIFLDHTRYDITGLQLCGVPWALADLCKLRIADPQLASQVCGLQMYNP